MGNLSAKSNMNLKIQMSPSVLICSFHYLSIFVKPSCEGTGIGVSQKSIVTNSFELVHGGRVSGDGGIRCGTG